MFKRNFDFKENVNRNKSQNKPALFEKFGVTCNVYFKGLFQVFISSVFFKWFFSVMLLLFDARCSYKMVLIKTERVFNPRYFIIQVQ